MFQDGDPPFATRVGRVGVAVIGAGLIVLDIAALVTLPARAAAIAPGMGGYLYVLTLVCVGLFVAVLAFASVASTIRPRCGLMTLAVTAAAGLLLLTFIL